jgi:hypothetical protein
MVVGPNWSGLVPATIKRVFRSSTEFAVAIYRAQLFGPADIDNVIKVQDGYKARALSDFLGKAGPPPAPRVNFPKFSAELAKTNFFEFLGFALEFAPPRPFETAIRAKLASIGVGSGKTGPDRSAEQSSRRRRG